MKIQEAKETMQPLAIAWLDVAKAFDSVSHSTITRAAERIGMPPPAVHLLGDMYDGATTEVRKDTKIRVTRGVRQGDPLSPHVFNAVIDEAIAGVERSGEMASPVMAFADDLVVLARTPSMLQHRVGAITDELAKAGLEVNADKCRVSITAVDGRNKRRFVDLNTEVRIGGKTLPNIGATSAIKYLGLEFGAVGICPTTGGKLRDHLDQLRKAPLKPQQRLFLLRANSIPGMLHQLVLGRCGRVTLRRLDQQVRRAVRDWLALPKDASDAYIHAAARDGGLGVPELSTTIPLLRTTRLENLRSSPYPPVKEMTERPLFRRLLQKCRPVTRGDRHLNSKVAVREENRRRLLRSVDGAGLKDMANIPSVSNWVTSPQPPVRGATYIGLVKTRGNLHQTSQRAARARGNPRTTCDAGCRRPETLGHVSQTCPRTADARTARHDRLLSLTDKFLKDRGAVTLREPAIPTPAGIRRPDLILKTRGKLAVIDAQVVADNFDLESAHQRKVRYYDNEDIRKFTADHFDGRQEQVIFGSVTFDWRGAVAKSTATCLKDLGLTDRHLGLLSLRTLEGTLTIWRTFRRSTQRGPRPTRRPRTLTGRPP